MTPIPSCIISLVKFTTSSLTCLTKGQWLHINMIREPFLPSNISLVYISPSIPSKLKFGIFVPSGNIVDSTSIKKPPILLNYKRKSGLYDCQVITKLQVISKNFLKTYETRCFIFYN